MTLSHENIAEGLLKGGFLLTALEFHAELLESGKEVNVLKDFFSDSNNFKSIENVHGSFQSPETPLKGGRRSAPGTPAVHRDISRAGSQLTLDSIDQLTRYSEDTDRREEDRLAVLEYELRTARDTISQLKRELSQMNLDTQSFHCASLSEQMEEEEDTEIKPHEKKILNFLVNDYLMRNGYKISAVTFSDECEGQNLDDWEEVGVISDKPLRLSSILRRQQDTRTVKSAENNCDSGSQTEDGHNIAEEKLETMESENKAYLSTISDLKEKIKDQKNCAERQYTKMSYELKSRIEELENEKLFIVENMKTLNQIHEQNCLDQEREDGDGASLIDEPVTVPLTALENTIQEAKTPNTMDQFIQMNIQMIPRPVSEHFQKYLLKKTFPINLDNEMSYSKHSNNIADLLSSKLSQIISNLVLSSRSDAVPLIIWCINNSKGKKIREQMFNCLFNIAKKPDETLRSAILTGLFWLVHQNGWHQENVEEEILPHLLEQINVKYFEKKILVGDCISILGIHVGEAIRSSLLVSLCLQLIEVKTSDVIRAGMRSLSTLVNYISDGDKISKIHGIIQSDTEIDTEALQDLKEIILPPILIWQTETDEIWANVNSLMEKIEEYVPADEALSNNDTFHVDNALRSKESMMENISLMEDIMPFVIYKVIKTCPKVKTDNNAIYKQPKKLEEIFGEEFGILYKNFCDYVSPEWFKKWSEYEKLSSLLSRMIKYFSKVKPSSFPVLRKYSKLLSRIVELSGTHFSSNNLFKILQIELGPRNITLYSILIHSYFSQEKEDESTNIALSIMKDFLKKSDNDIENRALNAIMKLVCEDNMQKEFLRCLYQFLEDPDAEMRISFSQCLSSLMENNLSHDKEIVPKLIIPAVLSLSVDMEIEVQISSVKPLVTLFSLEYLEFEVRKVNENSKFIYSMILGKRESR